MTAQSKFARNLQKLLAYAYSENIDFLMYELWRTSEQQKKMFDKGTSQLDGTDKISKHQIGRAVDLVIKVDGKAHWDRHWQYEKLGQYWKSLGGVWGGYWKNFPDIYHFQM